MKVALGDALSVGKPLTLCHSERRRSFALRRDTTAGIRLPLRREANPRHARDEPGGLGASLRKLVLVPLLLGAKVTRRVLQALPGSLADAFKGRAYSLWAKHRAKALIDCTVDQLYRSS